MKAIKPPKRPNPIRSNKANLTIKALCAYGPEDTDSYGQVYYREESGAIRKG